MASVPKQQQHLVMMNMNDFQIVAVTIPNSNGKGDYMADAILVVMADNNCNPDGDNSNFNGRRNFQLWMQSI